MNDNTFLKTIFNPSSFSAEELELVLDQFEAVSFEKHDFLIDYNRTANYYYFLEDGFARSYAIDIEGNDITTAFFSPGDIVIDWHAYFLKTPTRESIQALTPCRAHKISFERFMKLFHIEAFREVGRTRLINNYFSLKAHSVSMISDQAKDRYLQLLKSKPEILLHAPLKHVATFLGITDTSLSRIRKQVAKENE